MASRKGHPTPDHSPYHTLQDVPTPSRDVHRAQMIIYPRHLAYIGGMNQAHKINYEIRWARPDDAAHIVRLIKDLAAFEKEPESSVKMTEADILRDGFGMPSGSPVRFECLIGEKDGDPVGLCLFFHNYSTWEGRAGLYIEELFVSEQLRGSGLGRDLMAAMAAIAVARNCPRIDLSVLHWNPARAFYERQEMHEMDEWRSYRMERDAIAKLAQHAQTFDAGL